MYFPFFKAINSQIRWKGKVVTLMSFHGGCHCGLGKVAAFFCWINAVDDLFPPTETNALDEGPSLSFPPEAEVFCWMAKTPGLSFWDWSLWVFIKIMI